MIAVGVCVLVVTSGVPALLWFHGVLSQERAIADIELQRRELALEVRTRELAESWRRLDSQRRKFGGVE